MQWILTIVIGLVALTVGTAVGYVIRQQQAIAQAKEHAAELVRIKATTEAHNKELELKAKDDLLKRRDELEIEAARRKPKRTRTRRGSSAAARNWIGGWTN